MNTPHSLYRRSFALSALACVALFAGCSKPAPTVAESGATPAAVVNTASPMQAASKLGDLSAFKRIAEEVASAVDKGDLPAGKARIKDLETDWDAAEAGLKPRAAQDWHVLDRSLNDALSALRADSPNAAECKKAMADLLHHFDLFQGKA